MGVVDEHNQAAPSCPFDQGTGVAAQQSAVVLASWIGTVRVRGQHRREGPKGQPPRGMRRGRAGKRHPPVFGQLKTRHGERRLPYPGGTCDNRPPPFKDGRAQLR